MSASCSRESPVCPPGQPQPGATPRRNRAHASPADLKLGERWSDLLRGPIGNYEPRIIGIVLNAWASLQGYLVAEVLGNLPILIDDIDSLCRAHVRTVDAGMGFDRVLIDAAVR